MFFVVVLSLAALAAAVPVKYDQQLQELEDVSPLQQNYNRQLYYPFLMNMKETQRNARYFPYYGKVKENYPFLPYNYENSMSYPYRSNYFLRYMNTNNPEMSKMHPKIDYDYMDIYHLHDVNHHHLVNNIHDFKEKQTIRKVGREMEYFHYSPKNQYMNRYNYYNRAYPFVYGKNVDQEYIQPYYSQDYPVNQYYGKSLNQEYIQPYNYYNRYWDMDYIKNYMDYVKPTMSRFDVEYTKPIYSENQYLKYVKPVTMKKLDLVKPILTKNFQYVKPIVSQNVETEYLRPVVSKKLNIEYVKPVYPLYDEFEQQDNEFVPDRSSRILDEEYNYGTTPNTWDVEQLYDILNLNRFKRDLAAQQMDSSVVLTPIKQETPVVEMDQQIAKVLNQDVPVTGTVQMNHQMPVVLHPEVAAELMPQEGLRSDVQLNTNENVKAILQAEDHISQQPIQMQ